MRKEQDTAPCKWCEKPTSHTGTMMCDGCWELDHRVRGEPDLALRILQTVRPGLVELSMDESGHVIHTVLRVAMDYAGAVTNMRSGRVEFGDRLSNAVQENWLRSISSAYEKLADANDRLMGKK